RFHQIFPFDYERLIRDAAKFREHVGIMNLIPISKGGAHQFRSRRPRGAFDDKMFAIEKILGVIRIAGDIGRESREWRKDRIRQFPAVTDKLHYSPSASSRRMRSHQRGRPKSEIKIAVA